MNWQKEKNIYKIIKITLCENPHEIHAKRVETCLHFFLGFCIRENQTKVKM